MELSLLWLYRNDNVCVCGTQERRTHARLRVRAWNEESLSVRRKLGIQMPQRHRCVRVGDVNEMS